MKKSIYIPREKKKKKQKKKPKKKQKKKKKREQKKKKKKKKKKTIYQVLGTGELKVLLLQFKTRANVAAAGPFQLPES